LLFESGAEPWLAWVVPLLTTGYRLACRNAIFEHRGKLCKCDVISSTRSSDRVEVSRTPMSLSVPPRDGFPEPLMAPPFQGIALRHQLPDSISRHRTDERRPQVIGRGLELATPNVQAEQPEQKTARNVSEHSQA
jgi:hypothetical protein